MSGSAAKPFNKKHTHSFASANTMPAMAGPAKRETWKAMALSATALGIKARSPTIRCTSAGRGPASSALIKPMPSAKGSNKVIFISPAACSAAMLRASKENNPWVSMTNLRSSKRSASQPPMGANTKYGSMVSAATTPKIVTDPVSE